MSILMLINEKLSIIMYVIGGNNASVKGWAPHTDDDSLVFGLGVYALVSTVSKRLFVMCLILMCVGFIP